MSSSSVNPLSAGVQQLFDKGLLPSSLNNTTLNHASASQLNKLAANSIASQETNVLLGLPTDSATLSSTATDALLHSIDSTSANRSSSTDALTAAVENQLTSSLNSAVHKFVPDHSSTSGNINLLG